PGVLEVVANQPRDLHLVLDHQDRLHGGIPATQSDDGAGPRQALPPPRHRPHSQARPPKRSRVRPPPRDGSRRPPDAGAGAIPRTLRPDPSATVPRPDGLRRTRPTVRVHDRPIDGPRTPLGTGRRPGRRTAGTGTA